MLAILLKLLASPRALAIAVAGVLVLLAGIQSLRLVHAKGDLAAARLASTDTATGKSWRSEAEAATRALGACLQRTEAMRQAIERQATATAMLKQESARASAAAASALAAARSASQSQRARADEILAAKRGVGGCAAADALILRSLGAGR